MTALGSGSVPREIAIANRHPRLKLDLRALALAIATLDAHAARFHGGCPPGELSLVFLTDPALARLHADFLDDPTTTDVITFAGDPSLGTAGEICVSADTAATYAHRHGRDFSTELTLYVIHGWLHLAGYDDLAPAQKRRMRAAEARAQKLLTAARIAPHCGLRK
ncbi:MAG: rRNA maturation RNase YbeY [Opitutaceae bacterium]|nr:rRNA maturation RNase YbeY [Opitutaceae bacterium]